MVFRLPTPFDAIAPAPPSGRRSTRSRPWRGAFNLHGINIFQTPTGQQRLLVASAETEGDKSSRTDLWPRQFELHFAQHTCQLSEVQAWVARNDIPLCMFMPDRHAPGGNINDTHFRTLSRVLLENQWLCVAPWRAEGFQETRNGASLLIFPSSSSTGLLVGAVFLNSPFPDFVRVFSGGTGADAVPSGLPSDSASAGSFANFDSSVASSYALPNSGPFSHGSGHGQRHVQNQFRSESPAHFMRLSDPFAQAGPATGTGYSYGYGKQSQMDSGIAGDHALRSALAAGPFDWAMFDETDGSGSTSPGSTRTY